MDNTQKFSGKADVYAKARPGYAPEAITFIKSLGLTKNSTVADMGSGTGIFSKYLLDIGAQTYGIEPNEEMRKKAEENLRHYTNFHSIATEAEHTPLSENSIDFITAAQSFHWFDMPLFKKECQRLLKPEGTVILLWNNGLSNPMSEEYAALFRRFSPPSSTTHPTDTLFENIERFYRNYEVQRFSNTFVQKKEIYVAACLSTSQAIGPKHPQYPEFVKELERLFDRYQTDGTVCSLNETVLYVGKI